MDKRPKRSEPDASRRRALAKLGLGVAMAYSAPTLLHLDRSANARFALTPCNKGKGKGQGKGCSPPGWRRNRDRHSRLRDKSWRRR